MGGLRVVSRWYLGAHVAPHPSHLLKTAPKPPFSSSIELPLLQPPNIQTLMPMSVRMYVVTVYDLYSKWCARIKHVDVDPIVGFYAFRTGYIVAHVRYCNRPSAIVVHWCFPSLCVSTCNLTSTAAFCTVYGDRQPRGFRHSYVARWIYYL